MAHRKPLSSQWSPRSSTRPNHFPYIINPSLMHHPPVDILLDTHQWRSAMHRRGWSKGVSVGIGTRNVIAFRCRERYFGEISGLNRRSISIGTPTSRSTHTHGICMSEWIPLRRDATWTAHTISIRPENRRNSWNQYTIPSSFPPPSLHSGYVLYVGHVSVGDTKRGRGRKRATVFFFRIDRRNRKDTNGSKFRRYLVKLLIDRTSSME